MFCIGVVINWFIMYGYMSDSEYMMVFNFVVIICVVIIRIFICKFVRIDIVFEYDFSICGYF